MKKKVFNKKNLYYVFLFIVVIFFALVGLSSSPLNKGITQNDSAVFQIMGKGMIEGQVIYKELFDHKGPIMYLINAIAYLISPQMGLFIVEIFFIYIGVVFIFKTSKMFINKEISLIMSLLYLMLIFVTISGGNFTEEYAMTFTSMALYCIMKIIYMNEYENKVLWVVIGATFALNFFIKPTYIAVWIAFGIIQFIYSVKEKKIKELLRYIFYMIIGILVVTIPIMIYLVLNNDINDFINAFFVMNMKYSKAGVLKKTEIFLILINRYKFVKYIITGIVCNILILFNKKINLKNRLFVTSFFIISIILAAWAPNVYKHYLTQLAPAIVLELIEICLFIKENLKLNERENKVLRELPKSLIFIVLIFCIILVTGNKISKDLGIFSRTAKDGANTNYELDELKKYLENDDEIIVLGNQPYYYIYLNRYPKCKYFFQFPIILYDRSIKDEVQNYIVKNRPKIIIKYIQGYNEEDFRKMYGEDVDNFIKNKYKEHIQREFKYYVLEEK